VIGKTGLNRCGAAVLVVHLAAIEAHAWMLELPIVRDATNAPSSSYSRFSCHWPSTFFNISSNPSR
jgi:hypothetical protein